MRSSLHNTVFSKVVFVTNRVYTTLRNPQQLHASPHRIGFPPSPPSRSRTPQLHRYSSPPYSRTLTTTKQRRKRRKRPLPSRLIPTDDPTASSSSSSSSTASVQIQELLDAQSPSSSSSSSSSSSNDEPFVARDIDGNEIDMEEYLEFATLSPWVPCPDPVARKVLDIARVGKDDVHYELGSGDGRLNFHAIDPPYTVQKSIGIDIDPNLLSLAHNRTNRRHPKPTHLSFLQHDLLDVSSSSSTTEVWETMRSEATVVTMYFVQEALVRLKPLLVEYLGGREGGRIVTVGYGVPGWETEWEEVCLGLKLHLYDAERIGRMSDVEEEEGLDGEPPPEEEIYSGRMPLGMEEEEGEEGGVGGYGGDGVDGFDEERDNPFRPPDEGEEMPDDPMLDVPGHWDDFDDVEEEHKEEDGDKVVEVEVGRMEKEDKKSPFA